MRKYADSNSSIIFLLIAQARSSELPPSQSLEYIIDDTKALVIMFNIVYSVLLVWLGRNSEMRVKVKDAQVGRCSATLCTFNVGVRFTV